MAVSATATIRPAGADDCDQLGVIGPAAYAEAYCYLWSDPAAYAVQLTTFGRDAFALLHARPDARIWVAEVGGRIVGFLSMILGSRDPVLGRPGGAELPRIYLLGPVRGAGLGRRLLEAAIATARGEGASHVWLDVMATADWARRSYAVWGFREIGADRFEKGVRNGMDEMIVMMKDID
ncbi:GNAT family N-acetyltransferase [Bradyrhizobium sp.]|uniref:GNAT family N-acetyltransferase n=1 Tax=Bradyrhizobium sp. TaxID=376 RepID=UPI0025BAAD56|nr:GNAT family N-acetyltransferase [Bradyrhizobium sp.]MCA3567067.1 GNAT family N-acetyltransferase [Bradyrhizobium sp.]